MYPPNLADPRLPDSNAYSECVGDLNLGLVQGTHDGLLVATNDRMHTSQGTGLALLVAEVRDNDGSDASQPKSLVQDSSKWRIKITYMSVAHGW